MDEYWFCSHQISFLWCGDVGHCNTFLKFKCTACVIRFILEEGLICGKV